MMSDQLRHDSARLCNLFTRKKLSYLPSHRLWLFGSDTDYAAAQVVEQYIAERVLGNSPYRALVGAGLGAPAVVTDLLERHPAVRRRIDDAKSPALATERAEAVKRVEVSIRPHTSYGVHRFTSDGDAGSSETLADGLTLHRAQEMANAMADASDGAELYTLVSDETICVNDETGRQEVPAAFEHIYQMLTELPFGVSYTLSLINLRQGVKKQPALRIVRHIPVPVKKPKPAWEDLTLAEMQQAWIETALREQGYENAKQLRLKAYRERDTEFIAMLDRIGVAVDVVDPGAAVN